MLVLFRAASEESKQLANKFKELSGLKCELCEAEGYEFEVLEHLELPVVFIIDKSDELHEFIVKREKDSRDMRMQAYSRRYLNNLRFVVVNCEDLAFAQFVDEGLKGLGAKRLLNLCSEGLSEDYFKEFHEKIMKK